MNAAAAEFTVHVDDNFHYQDEDERYKQGVYPTYGEALQVCRSLVCSNLEHFFKPGMTCAELLGQYSGFGEDPFIIPTPEGTERFSALQYAQERAAAMCGQPAA